MSNIEKFKKLVVLKLVEQKYRVAARFRLANLKKKSKRQADKYSDGVDAGLSMIELASIQNIGENLDADIVSAEKSLSNMNRNIEYLNRQIKVNRDDTDANFSEAYKDIRSDFNNEDYTDEQIKILDGGVRAVVSDIPLNYNSEALPLLGSALANPYGTVQDFKAALWTMRDLSDDKVAKAMKVVRNMIAADVKRFNDQATDSEAADEFRGLDYIGDMDTAAAALYSSLRDNNSEWRNGVYHVLKTEIAQISKGGRVDNLNVRQINIIIRLSNWLRPVARKYTMTNDGELAGNESVRWCWFAPYEGYSAASNYYNNMIAKGDALKAESTKIKKARKALIDSGAVRLIDSKGVPQN